MKFLTVTATGLAALVATTGANAQSAKAASPAVAAAPSVKVSEKARPAVVALQAAVTANDRARIPGALAAAKAAAQTSDDRWMIAGLEMKAALAVKDYAGMATALDAIVAAGHATPAQAVESYKTIATEEYNAKDYSGAAALFEKASKLDPSDTEALTLQGRSLVLGGKANQAVPIIQRAIKASAASGAKVDENLYRLAVQAAFDSKSPATLDLARQWLSAYPSADSWHNTLLIYRGSAELDDVGSLALLRLMNATGGLTSAADYERYLKGALLQSNFNEAHAVLDQAIAAKVLTPSSAIATEVSGKPKASAADLIAASKNAQSGAAVLKIGDRMYGLGEYAQAADLYRKAKARGVDAGTADLSTGIALARAGDKAGAVAALKGVSRAQAGIAEYWLLYLAK
ncbi:MAG: hypothetical protein ABIW33_01790 [Sphingomicrobium sp.]